MRPSSVIVVTRGHGHNLELFWSQRRHRMAFLGGFWAFAGGSIEQGDGDVPLVGSIATGFPDRSFYGCAARETFEELGLWVTDAGVRHVATDPDLAELRARLHTTADFAAALRERGESVDAERFHPIGTWETPEWFEIPFFSEFFALALTSQENDRFGALLPDHLLADELVVGEWSTPTDALQAWARAERYMTLPIRRHLEALDAASRASDVEIHSADLPFHYEEWLVVPGIRVFPLKSPTIPPATHTNCIVVGDERFVIIDPGSPYSREQEMLGALVAQMLADGRGLDAIVLTHHHPDHVGGVAALVEQFGCPVWAHARTADHLDLAIARRLDSGDRIALGDDTLECVYTPGHASGHLCFHHTRTNATFVGDLVASRGTILVNPPDGHMGDYLASLGRVRDLAPRALYPAHGWIITNPAERLQFYIDHRMEREEKVLRALEAFGKPATAADLVPEAYADTPAAIWPIAARSAEAHLIHLLEIGRARASGEKYSAS